MASFQHPSASSGSVSWDPWVVLGFDPDDEEFTCVGINESHGDQCRNRINRGNRDEASDWLSELSQTSTVLAADSDDLLFELASCVLCLRYHQDQAEKFVKNWQRRIRAYEKKRARAVSTPRTSQGRPAQSLSEPRGTGDDTLDRYSQPSPNNRSRLPSVISSRAGSPSPKYNTLRNDPSTPEDGGARPDTMTSIATMIEQLSLDDCNRARLENAIRAEYIRAFITDNGQRSSAIRPLPQIETINSSTSSRPPPTQLSPSQRSVEGDCPICLEGLTTLNPPPQLACCIGTCRQYFHKTCIQQWRGSRNGEDGGGSPTCPCW